MGWSLAASCVMAYVDSDGLLDKHLQVTGKQPVHVEGNLIAHTRLQFKKHGLSRLFSLKL